MKANTASRTAQYMALFRAIETRRPAGNRLFYDPFAIHFLDTRLKWIANMSALPIIRRLVTSLIHKKGPGAISSGIGRTKYIDDLLEKTVQTGAKQLILLGAGFDTRALRLACLKNIPVIEIDHPDTATFKLARLKTALITFPSHISYIHVDFNRQSLEEIAATGRFNFDLPTTVIWEGVTNYLTATAVEATFRFTQQFTGKLAVIFTYIDQQVLIHPENFLGTKKLFANLRSKEEKWTFGFVPGALSDYLARFNLTLVEDRNTTEYRHSYMPERTSLSEGYEFYRVAFANR